MARITEGSVDAIVCDPPYGLEFMGKKFDSLGEGTKQQEWHAQWLRQAHRVLRPGGVIKAFGGTRTFHRLAAAMAEVGFQDIGLEAWTYSSGFPKSLNISKSIDKTLGKKRKVIGTRKSAFGNAEESETNDGSNLWSKPSTKTIELTGEAVSDLAKKWEGWGTALKPAWEPICVGRKP
jgi:site-specific DNA-methyltransferase (adenine-specific)